LFDQQPLGAGVERMALRANLYPDFFFGGTGFETVTASAANLRFLIFGMNAFSQLKSPLY
jgi:hypothetical protein